MDNGAINVEPDLKTRRPHPEIQRGLLVLTTAGLSRELSIIHSQLSIARCPPV